MPSPDIILVRVKDTAMGVFRRIGADQHPMNLVCLATWLRRLGFSPEIVDLQVEPPGYLEERLAAARPTLVGITATTPDIPESMRISALCARLGIRTVLGGVHPSALPELTLKDAGCDYVIAGEGEKPLGELLRALKEGSSPEHIDGLAFIRDGLPVVNPRPGLMDIDDLPLPDRRFLKLDRYSGNVTPGILSGAATMFTSRGCPYGCAFCASGVINRRQVRFRSMEKVFEEVDDVVRLGFTHITVDDDCFTLDERRVKAFCAYLMDTHPRVSWDCDSRVDAVNAELLGLMKLANCRKIAFGVESGSPRVLRSVGKAISLEKVREAFRLTRERGMLTQGFFMAGFPEETAEDIEATIRFIEELDPDFVLVTTAVPFPGTALREEMTAKGFLADGDWGSLRVFNDSVPWRTRHFSGRELVRIRKRIGRSAYFRPRAALRRLLSVRSMRDLAYLVKGGVVAVRAFCG